MILRNKMKQINKTLFNKHNYNKQKHLNKINSSHNKSTKLKTKPKKKHKKLL